VGARASRARRACACAALVACVSTLAASFAACSSSRAPAGPSDDAGAADATLGDGALDVDAALPPDDTGPGRDTALPPLPDSSPVVTGNCEPVQGPACDLVLQNCAPGDAGPTQCFVATAADGGYTTACVDVAPSQHLVKGHGCCPASSALQCDQGLECIGDPNQPCDGGGPPPGRCTPHCCSGGDASDDFLCGSSVPEGYPGHCDTLVVNGSDQGLYYACTYDIPCEPFRLEPCPSGSTCEIVDPSGTAQCDTIYTTGGGAPPTEGQPCVALNNCADGLVCLGPTGSSVCYMLCLTPGAATPFDAGALAMGPGTGGCVSTEQCNIPISGYPAWISVCGAPP
jgi:hypothetical protein